jgi:4-hydroxy-3-methylbut-2-enyl diphosphate reductase
LTRSRPEDVVILPAFGITIELLQQLERQGCTLVDTTCGSVLNVWKNVRRYTAEGFTSIIHGKFWHEETRATASQAASDGGHYLVVLDHAEAASACEYIRHAGDPRAFLAQFERAVSPGFDPDRDLQRLGCANQTTMLSSESLAIAEMFRDAVRSRYGDAELDVRFRSFDTICSATQDRQDAVAALLDQRPLDLMIVIGGYNSSNTCNLARICEPKGADVPHRRAGRTCVTIRDPAQAGWREGRTHIQSVAADVGPRIHRVDLGRVDTR